MGEEKVRIELSWAEALVLDRFLHRWEESGTFAIEDEAEEYALWQVKAPLEKVLWEPFAENYSELLQAARTEVRNRYGG